MTRVPDPEAPASLRVREARPADRERIRELTLRAYAEYATRMTPAAWTALEQALHAALADDTGVTRLVADLGGVIVGSAALHEPASAAYGSLASGTPWPEVRLVAVDPSARGRGVARALVSECADRARQAGATELGLHTSRSMTAAIRLYQRMGFVRDPDHDFHPPGAELVEGYRLHLGDPARTPEH